MPHAAAVLTESLATATSDSHDDDSRNTAEIVDKDDLATYDADDDLYTDDEEEYYEMSSDEGSSGAEFLSPEADSILAEDIILGLPSQLPRTHHLTKELRSLVDKERQLRLAQAEDALADIRRLRRVITGITQFKRLNINGTGQRDISRWRSLYKKFQNKIQLSATRYRTAFHALRHLDPDGKSTSKLQPLLASDIRGPGQDDDPLFDPNVTVEAAKRKAKRAGTRKGYYELSWIWRVHGIVDSNEDLNSKELYLGVRAEWAKASTRVDRWREERRLLEEEMRRVLAYFEWKRGWWIERGGLRADEPSVRVRAGLQSYAEKQADIYDRLRTTFTNKWTPFFQERRVTPPWEDRPPRGDVPRPTPVVA